MKLGQRVKRFFAAGEFSRMRRSAYFRDEKTISTLTPKRLVAGINEILLAKQVQGTTKDSKDAHGAQFRYMLVDQRGMFKS